MRRGDETLAELARELHHTPAAVDPPAAVPVNPFVGVGPAGPAASVLSVFRDDRLGVGGTHLQNPDRPDRHAVGGEPLGGDSTGLATRIRLIRRSSIAPQRRITPKRGPVIASRACQVRVGTRARAATVVAPSANAAGPEGPWGVMKHGTKNKKRARERTKRTTRGQGMRSTDGRAGHPRPWLRWVGRRASEDFGVPGNSCAQAQQPRHGVTKRKRRWAKQRRRDDGQREGDGSKAPESGPAEGAEGHPRTWPGMVKEEDMSTKKRNDIAAEILARLLYGRRSLGEGDTFERDERVADALWTHGRQRALVWLRQTLEYDGVSHRVLHGLEFDWPLVDNARTLAVRPGEDRQAYAERVAACEDADVLAVAVATIDDEIREAKDQQGARDAYREVRRVLSRAADALPTEPSGDLPRVGAPEHTRPSARAQHEALLSLVDHATGAERALQDILRGPEDEPGEAIERLSPDDMELLLDSLHKLLQVAGMVVIGMTTREGEITYEDRRALEEGSTEEVSLMEEMRASAEMIARRLRDAIEDASLGEKPEDGKVH